MNYRSYVIALCSFFCALSEAMDSDLPTYDLVTLTTAALLKAKTNYESSDEKAKNPQNLKKLVDTALSKTIEENEVTPCVLPVIYSMLRQFRTTPPVYDTTKMICEATVGAVDIQGDGTRIVVGIGGRAHVLSKHCSWEEDDYIDHNSPITAVCLAGNNRAASTDRKGSVFVWSYDDWSIATGTAFRLSDPEQANMIALNDAGDRLVCGLSKPGEPLYIYKCTVAHWDQEKAEIPIYNVLVPESVGWTAKNTVIAYGKPLDETKDNVRAITEWERVLEQWYMRANVNFTEDKEHEVLASGGYKLTRRGAQHAVSEAGEVKVSGKDKTLTIHESSLSYEAIMEHFSKEWDELSKS